MIIYMAIDAVNCEGNVTKFYQKADVRCKYKPL